MKISLIIPMYNESSIINDAIETFGTYMKERFEVIPSIDDVIKELRKSLSIWKNYKKSEFTKDQQTFLLSNMGIAINRAKGLKEFQNPSTGIYKLIELLNEEVRKYQT